MTVLTTIPNGADMHDVRDTLNWLIAKVSGSTAPALGTLTPSTGFKIGAAITNGTLTGATSGSTITTNIPGITVNSDARTYAGTPTGSAGANANGFVETLAGATGSPKSTAVTVAAASTAPPTGFALNGSTNSALKAMMTNKVGTIVIEGDSIPSGAGAGITENGTSSSIQAQCAGAQPYRGASVLAGLMTSAGIPAYDNSFVGDQGMTTQSVNLIDYDPRITFTGGDAWSASGGQGFAGGNYFTASGHGTLNFTPTSAVDRFDLFAYSTGGVYTINVDGAAPASITAPGCTIAGNTVTLPAESSGLVKITVAASSLGSHTLQVSGGGSTPIFHGITGYSSAAPGIQLLNHAANGAQSGDIITSGSDWKRLDALKAKTPKLTIIRVGINDTSHQDPSTYQANLATIIAAAKVSGDVLVCGALAANPSNFQSEAMQGQYIAAAAAAAQAAGVAFADLRAKFGMWADTSARTADGLVHPNRGYHADIGAHLWACVQAMAA